MYLAASAQNRSCNSRSFGFSGGEVVGLAEVIVHLVEFPLVAIDVRQLSAKDPWGNGRRSAGDPAVIVNGAVGEHLEILSSVRRQRFRIVERIREARTFDRFLRYAVEH